MKATITPVEIAAISGHGVTATASAHYGKRRSSWPLDKIPAHPRPVQEELAVVREVVKLYENRMNLEVKSGLRRASEVGDFPV